MVTIVQTTHPHSLFAFVSKLAYDTYIVSLFAFSLVIHSFADTPNGL
jgi:hypothetical protein